MTEKKKPKAVSPINYAKKARERRKPYQIPGRRLAIVNFCRECQGFDGDGSGSLTNAIRECPAIECWLWPWRTGSLAGKV